MDQNATVIEYPTTKQQLISSGISVVTAIAVTAAAYGTMYVLDKVGSKIRDRKTAKKNHDDQQ